jgi:electron-transferring-flavoprotein dehydrogenase
MHNEGTYTASLGNLCRWLAGQAEELGVEIFPGFPPPRCCSTNRVRCAAWPPAIWAWAAMVIQNRIISRGWNCTRYTLFAEGARGHLTRQVVAQFGLDADSAPQVYGLGLKELWDIAPEKHQPGLVIHTQGWPLTDAYGGGFSIIRPMVRWRWVLWWGLVIATRISRPLASFSAGNSILLFAPFWKADDACPMARGSSTKGLAKSAPSCLSRRGVGGMRGGFRQCAADQGQPYGDEISDAGGRCPCRGPERGRRNDTLGAYEEALRNSWVAEELRMVRNVQPLLARFGAIVGTALAGLKCGCARWGSVCPIHWVTRAIVPCALRETARRLPIPRLMAWSASTASLRFSCRTPIMRRISRSTCA